MSDNDLEQSRRDDLESLGYVMLYFCRGSLPWQGLQASNKEQRYKQVMEKKLSTSCEDLCRGLPKEFAIYLNHVRSLRFDEKPNYSYLRKMFRALFVLEGFKYDHVFDWTVRKYLLRTQAITQAVEDEDGHQVEKKEAECSLTKIATLGDRLSGVGSNFKKPEVTTKRRNTAKRERHKTKRIRISDTNRAVSLASG